MLIIPTPNLPNPYYLVWGLPKFVFLTSSQSVSKVQPGLKTKNYYNALIILDKMEAQRDKNDLPTKLMTEFSY